MNTSVLEVGCILLPENYRTWCMELERAKGARPIFFSRDSACIITQNT